MRLLRPVRAVGVLRPHREGYPAREPGAPRGVRVERTIAWTGATPTTVPPKTKGSRRRVPLTAVTTAMLRDYLVVHPRRDDSAAPLFPNVRLRPPRPTACR